jgi:hypothetical protein
MDACRGRTTSVRIATAPATSSPATVTQLACAQRCGATVTVRPGSLLRVRGKTLSRADDVVLLGIDGEADDVAGTPNVRRRPR